MPNMSYLSTERCPQDAEQDFSLNEVVFFPPIFTAAGRMPRCLTKSSKIESDKEAGIFLRRHLHDIYTFCSITQGVCNNNNRRVNSGKCTPFISSLEQTHSRPTHRPWSLLCSCQHRCCPHPLRLPCPHLPAHR